MRISYFSIERSYHAMRISFGIKQLIRCADILQNFEVLLEKVQFFSKPTPALIPYCMRCRFFLAWRHGIIT